MPITNANKPGNAILTLGTSGAENGFTFKTNGSAGAFRVRGGVWSNSTVVRDNNGVLESTESIRARSGCTPRSAMLAPVVDCASVAAPDPGYPSDLDVEAGGAVPPLRTPPSCGSGTAELQPGYYDDVTGLNALTPNGGGGCLVHLNPGTYYLDFHNKPGDVLHDPDVAGVNDNVWTINSGTVVGGTLTSDTTVPGRCVNPIDDTGARGVQLVLGGDSRIRVDKGAVMELCGSYRSGRPPIAVYGQRTGTAVQTVVPAANALTATGTPTATAGTFVGATADAVRTVDGTTAAWTRNGTGPATNQTGSLTTTGFAPASPLPPGTVLTGARLKVTHRSTGAQNVVTLTASTGTGLAAYALPARSTLGTEDVDLSARAGWGALQKSVHDGGLTGATIRLDASLGRNQVAQVDAIRLELTYYLPSLRGQTTAAVPGNTVATPGGEPVVKALGNTTVFYVQGTTYAPLASVDLALNNISESVFRFGVVVRSLSVFETASFTYPGAVIELPDNSPGYGFGSTLVQLQVYVCPAAPTCSATTGRLALTGRVQLWDPTGEAVAGRRQVTVLSWSHLR